MLRLAKSPESPKIKLVEIIQVNPLFFLLPLQSITSHNRKRYLNGCSSLSTLDQQRIRFLVVILPAGEYTRFSRL